MNRLRARIQNRLRLWLLDRGVFVARITAEEQRYLRALYPPTPAQSGADGLRPDDPELIDLRQRYESFDQAFHHSWRWGKQSVAQRVDLRRFRGDTLYVWHYRERPRHTRLKFYAYLRYVLDIDSARLLDRLEEDGAFGCWTFPFSGLPTVSRDLLDSVNEILFLERQFHVLSRPGLRVLDIGAGYGRLAHRLSAAAPALGDYCCVDAVPESTYLSRHYLAYRRCSPPARVVALDRVTADLAPGSFDLAVNIHSFSECTYEAIAWWVEQLRRLRVPSVLIVPNDQDHLLSLEADRSRKPFADLLQAAGYRIAHTEPVIADAAVRELIGVRDAFVLWRLPATSR